MVLEPWIGGVGTGGWRFWNRRLAVLEPGRLDSKIERFLNTSIDELGFETGCKVIS
jgi:hypothetical protein